MKLGKLSWIFITLLASLPILKSSSVSTPPIVVGNQKQLFVDHRFIESSEGITLTMHEPYETGEKLIGIDQPWEKGCEIAGSTSVLKEDGPNGPVVRMWYDVYDVATGGLPGTGFRGAAYAESSDGIHFHKPILGLLEVKGSRQNNLVMPTDPAHTASGGCSVLRDTNPRCPPDERYKSWSKFYSTPGTLKGENRIWRSPDGLHWKLYDTVPTGLRKADTQPTWFWDSRIGRYIGYSREWVDISANQTIRMVGYNESDDMLHWDNFSLALKPDELDGNPYGVRRVLAGNDMQKGAKYNTEDVSPTSGFMDIYGPGAFKYSEAQDVYISLFPAFYHFRRHEGGTTPDTADLQMAISRDGRNFSRMGGRHPFMRLGPSGSFYSKWVWPVLQPIRMNNELWLYYWGTNQDHSSHLDPAAKHLETSISRSILRLDGFVSADAGYSGGSLTTPPIVFDGTKLELNLDTSAGGQAQVEIRDASGKAVAGYALAEADVLNGNNVSMPVTWQGKGDVSSLAGKTVQLYIKLRDCRLYAFQFK